MVLSRYQILIVVYEGMVWVLFYAVSSTSSTWICYNISLFVYKFITVVCCKSGFGTEYLPMHVAEWFA
jgi:hypothetical protein